MQDFWKDLLTWPTTNMGGGSVDGGRGLGERERRLVPNSIWLPKQTGCVAPSWSVAQHDRSVGGQRVECCHCHCRHIKTRTRKVEPTANNNDDDDDERNRLHDAVAIGREKKTFFFLLIRYTKDWGGGSRRRRRRLTKRGNSSSSPGINKSIFSFCF